MTDSRADRPDDITPLRESLPDALRDLIAGRVWHENHVGLSGTRVFRLDGPDGDQGEPGVLYLKISTSDTRNLHRERDRLIWLRGKLPTPDVRFFVEEDDRQIMLMTAIPGLPSFDAQFEAEQPQRVIGILADGLRQIHALPLADCPFDRTVSALIVQAMTNVSMGRIDASGFDDLYQGRSIDDMLAEALATRPGSEDLVFAHGDYCMPNVLIRPDDVTLGGFVDWGNAGVGDRYLDLALAARSITYNWGAQWVAPFFAAYGIRRPDAGKITFYRLIDELAWVP